MKISRGNIITFGVSVSLLGGGFLAYTMKDRLADFSSAANTSSSKNGSRQLDLAALADWQLKVNAADPEGFRNLMEEALKISDSELRIRVVTALVDRWLAEDPSGFTKYWAALEVHGQMNKLAIVALALEDSLTRLTPEQAASDEIFVVLQRLISYLAANNPDKALEWAKKWLVDDALEQALVSTARSFAHKDIEKALKVIEEMKSPLRRSQAIATVAGIWAAQDAKAAATWAQGLPNVIERAMAMNSVLMAMAQNDVSGSANDLRDTANSINEQYLNDRKAELEKLGMTEADMAEDSESYKKMLADGAVPPPYSPDVEMMGDAGKIIGAKLAEGDIAGALDYAESLDSDYLKLKTLSGILEGWAKTDPAAAAAYLNSHFGSNVDLYTSLYSSWASQNYQAAAQGTALISDPVARQSALESVLYQWGAKGDYNSMIDYVSTLPSSEFTDSVKAKAVSAISTTSAQQAWNIAMSIADEATQLRALRQAFSSMVIENPTQASAALASVQGNLPTRSSSTLNDMLQAVVGEN